VDKIRLTTWMRPNEVIEVEGPEYVDLCRQGLVYSLIPNHDVPIPGFDYSAVPEPEAAATSDEPEAAATSDESQPPAGTRRTRKRSRRTQTPVAAAPVNLTASAAQEPNNQEK